MALESECQRHQLNARNDNTLFWRVKGSMFQKNRAVVTRPSRGNRERRKENEEGTYVAKKKFPRGTNPSGRTDQPLFFPSRRENANDSSRNCHDTLIITAIGTVRFGRACYNPNAERFLRKKGKDKGYSHEWSQSPTVDHKRDHQYMQVCHFRPACRATRPNRTSTVLGCSASGDLGRSSPSGDRMQTNESNSRQHDLSRSNSSTTTTSNETLQQTQMRA